MLNKEETKILKEAAEKNNATLYMTILAVLYILLSKLSGQEDIIVGTPIAARNYTDLEHIIGMFVKTLAIRNYPSGNKTFKEFLKEVRNQTLNAFENQEYQFENLVEKISIGRDTSRNPVFDVMFTLQNIDISEVDLPGLKFTPYNYESKISKFDLGLYGIEAEADQKSNFSLEYCTKLFKKNTIERCIRYFKNIVSSFANPNEKISGVEIITLQEKKQILYDFNDTKADYPGKRTIHELFEEQVEKTPDHIAVVFEDKKLSYRGLDERSNRLVGGLTAKGIITYAAVGVMVERSIEMVVGILGILKAGGIYLPIDPEYPQERIQYMLRDSNVRILLTQPDLLEQCEFTGFNGDIIELFDDKHYTGNIEIRKNSVTSNDPIYIIYTSGSTGKPKGVMVEHRNVVRLVKNSNYLDFSEVNRLLLTGALAFDITTFEIWGPLLNGLSLYLVDKNVILDVEKLKNIVVENKISVLHLIPQLFNQVALNCPSIFAVPKYLLIGGDVVRSEYINEVRNRFKGLKIIHMYGPTENTTFSTSFPVEKDYETNIPIGKPIGNSSVFILDKYNTLQPIGIEGELCSGGHGVARGYLNSPELTCEKFLPDPFGSTGYMYKTGDIARWMPDGNIEFLGRIDHQVKIRGFRIELGEIEKVLLKHREIQDCVVMLREIKKDKQLVAYYKKRNKIQLWPSLAEYFVYDDLIYFSMTKDEARNEKYRNAIARVIKDKTALEIGPGNEAILSLMCIEGGAKKVYAVEKLENAFQKAREKIKQLGLEDRIILIHGDIKDVELPEPVDYCISEIVGSIGGSEGAAKIINHARNFIKDSTCMIPCRSVTKIAAITLPENEFECVFEEVGAYYVEKIFSHVGYPFDLRVCLFSFNRKNVISNLDVFEDLDFTRENLLEGEHEIYLEINENSILHGFIVWLNLYVDEEELIDSLMDRYIWLPIYLPVFSRGECVKKGDYIRAKITRELSKNGVNPNFTIEGKLYKKEAKPIDFIYHCPHLNTEFKSNNFYQELFSDDKLKVAGKITPGELRTFLSSELPGYMIPSYFLELEKIPLTANGKVDRKKLPDPNLETGEEYTAPRDAVERKLLEIWSEVLGIEKKNIGIDDDFFMIGGDSIKIIQIISRMNRIGYKVEMRDIFQSSKISELAPLIKKSEPAAEQSPITGIVPLTPIQKEFFDNVNIDSHHFNMAVMLRSEERLDEETLKMIFLKLQHHHDILRTTYTEENGEIIQTKRGIEYPISVQVYDYRYQAGNKNAAETIEARVNETQASIDLANGPLLRTVLFHLDDGDRLLIVVHHLVIDGVSWRILFEDIETLYRQYKKGEQLELQMKTASFKLWSEKLSEYANCQSFLKEKPYWMKLESNAIEPLKKDIEEEGNYLRNTNTLSFSLDKEKTKMLLTKVNEAFGTRINDILLTALGLTARRTFGIQRLLVALEGHGRETIMEDVDISRTIGWFTSRYPVILDMAYEEDLARQIIEIKDTLHQVPNQGIGHGILKFLTAGKHKRDIDFKLKPQVSFNYLGQFDPYGEQASLRIAKEPAGNTQSLITPREYHLEVSGMIVNSRLKMSIRYNKKQFRWKTVQTLVSRYETQLIRVIEFCSSREEREYTPSDFGYRELSIDDLNSIFN